MAIINIPWYLFPTFVALYVITNHFLHRILNLPPSPFLCFPIIGHLHLLKKPLTKTLSDLSAKHGPIFLLQLGNRRMLVVSSPAAAEECLTQNDIVFANRPRVSAGEHLGCNYTTMAWAPYGDHWRNLRRISSVEILSAHRIQMLSTIRKDEVNLLIRSLSENRNRPVEIKTVLSELTLNVMMRMIAGKRYYGENVKDLEEAERFRKIIKDTSAVGSKANLGDFFPLVKRLKIGVKGMVGLAKRREGFIQSLIDEHRQKQSGNDQKSSEKGEKSKTLIEVLLSLQETEPENYSDDIIRGLMLILLLAGTETTATTMEWALSLLLNHPQVLKKAQTEIEECVGNGRLLQESDINKLSYLRNIISETTRMYPSVPLLLPHESSEGCTVGGFYVPSGTTLLVNTWAIQNDSRVWEEPTKFKPERFEIVGENLTIRDGFRLFPFGSGRRGCPGETLATRMMGLTLGSLIQCFDWERVDEKMVDMTAQVGFGLGKAEPLRAICHPRPLMLNLLSQL